MTNVQKLVKEFEGIKNKIDQGDRIAATQKLNCHNETINRYMRGGVKKEAFALKLLGFLKNRIANREKILA